LHISTLIYEAAYIRWFVREISLSNHVIFGQRDVQFFLM